MFCFFSSSRSFGVYSPYEGPSSKVIAIYGPSTLQELSRMLRGSRPGDRLPAEHRGIPGRRGRRRGGGGGSR